MVLGWDLSGVAQCTGDVLWNFVGFLISFYFSIIVEILYEF